MIRSHHPIPRRLLQLEGNCGPISVWITLRHFRKCVAADRIIKACKHTKKYGSFTIALALALHRFGLKVVFYSEPDDDQKPIERIAYWQATKVGLERQPPLTPASLCQFVAEGKLVIVFIDTKNGEGHFSPIASIKRKRLYFVYGQDVSLPFHVFLDRWSAPGILRQCIVVHG